MPKNTSRLVQTFRALPGLASLAAFAVLLPATLWAAGGSSSSSVPSVSASPEATAETYYKRGLSYRDKAWKLEQKLADATGSEADKLRQKIQKEFGKAVKAQRSAVEANPKMYQAHSSLGYALRKSGELEASIEAYDQALALMPTYAEAIEYRAEAYLGLNRIEDAKDAYLLLVRTDQARADELMSAMRNWLSEQSEGSSSVPAADLEAFASWVEERADVAGHVAMIPSSQARGDRVW